jgi:hypothetical protein
MQSAEDRPDSDRVRFPAAVARLGLSDVEEGRGWIGNPRAQRHVRTPGIVQLDNVRPTVPIVANFSIHGIPGTAARYSFTARSTEHSRQLFTVA